MNTRRTNRAEDGSPSSEPTRMKDLSVSSTLTSGLNILGCFQTGAEVLTNAEIASRLGLNKATVSRLCKTLVAQCYLRRNPTGGFRLDPRILTLSYPVLASMSWRQRAQAIMDEVAEMANGNVSLSVFAGCDTVFIQTAGTPQDFPHVPEVGMTTPVPSASNGRALLAMLSEAERAEKLAEVQKVYPQLLAKHAKAIEEAVETCQTHGYCLSFGDWRKTVFGISSPVAITKDGLCVAMSCGIPAFRTSRGEIEYDLAPRFASSVEHLRQLELF